MGNINLSIKRSMQELRTSLIKGSLIVGCLLTILSSFGQQDFEKKIESLLKKMTVEEKVGQMTQVTLDLICEGQPFDENKEQKLNSEKLKKALIEYKVGSILNTGSHTLTRDNWYEIITEIQRVATKETRLKVPVIYGVDAIHGVNYTQGATLFPQELATAATWNPKFAEDCGRVTAYETRASAIPWNFSPVLDLGRQPLWSRMFETFGEDPYLATQMGNAIVKGYQGDDVSNPEKVAACLKHYMGYSNSKSGKDRTPIQMSEREMREYYLVTFKEAIENGAQTVMINSTEINGIPVHSSHHILTDILKDELEFDGFAVTDWEDIKFLHNTHRVAKTDKEAVKIAINAGVDMSMVPLDFDFAEYLVELVKEGEVPMSRIDDAVTRILRVKYRLGLFENAFFPMDRYPKFGSEEFSQLSYNAALESLTLLKNTDEVLPLQKGKKILLTGVGANSLNCLNGAWTHTWQGIEPKYNTKGKLTILEALKKDVGEANVSFLEGTSYDKDINSAELGSAAADVDYIIVCLGEVPATEKVGDINDLTYPKAQLDLIRIAAATGKPVVAVLIGARPRIFNEVEPLIDAVLNAYLPGDEGGKAISKTLIGDNNPSGKLPYTYPRFPNDLLTYDHKFSEEKDANFAYDAFNPQYEFGFGLSYSKFSYSELTASTNSFTDSQPIEVSIKVSNTGSLKGFEVVQLYSRDHFASITPSVKRLRNFKKIELDAGESVIVKFTISPEDLAFVNAELKWVTEPGAFDLMIGDQKVTVNYLEQGSIQANGIK